MSASGHSETELSIVVRIVGGAPFLRRCLSRLVPQLDGRSAEVIVPYDSTADGIDCLRTAFPLVHFVDIGGARSVGRSLTPGQTHELAERRTAKGFSVARGGIIALLEDYGIPAPDWCERVLEAHRLPYGAIGGALEHAGKGSLNWAVYFKDSGRYQLPLREGPVGYLSDANVSYKRTALESIREVWTERYNEAVVHWAMARKREVLWQSPQIVVFQDRGRLSLRQLAAERIAWGWLFAYVRTRESFPLRLTYIFSSPAIPLVLISRMARKVFSGRRHRKEFLRSFPHTVVLTWLWSLGELGGYLTGREPLK
jgi:hypothetical protein